MKLRQLIPARAGSSGERCLLRPLVWGHPHVDGDQLPHATRGGSVRLARCPATPSGAENGAITSPWMATGFSLPIGLRAGTLRQTLHWPGRWQYPIDSLRHRALRAAANAPAPDLTRRRRRRRPLQDSSGSNHSRCQLPLVCCIMDGGTLEQLMLRANFRRSRATHCCGTGDGLQPDPSNVHLNVGDW